MKFLLGSRFIYVCVLVLFITAAVPLAVSAQGLNPHLVVNVSWLNVRNGPGASNPIITTVPGGTILPVTGIDHRRVWFMVDSPAGPGWVNSIHAVDRGNFSGVPILNSGVDRQPGVAPGTPHLVINTYRLNVRSGPGINHSIIGKVSGGDELPVVSIDSKGLWYQVNTTYGVGWVNSHYAVTRGNFSGVPRSGGSTSTRVNMPIQPGAPHLVINTAYLNVRSGPGVGYGIITTVRGGSELPVSAISSSNRLWMEVTTPAGVGWVNSHYAARRGDFSRLTSPGESVNSPGVEMTGLNPRAVVNTHRLNLRSGPGVGHNIVTSVPGGTTLAVIGISRNRDWFLVQTNLGDLWMSSHYSVFRGDFSRVPFIG